MLTSKGKPNPVICLKGGPDSVGGRAARRVGLRIRAPSLVWRTSSPHGVLQLGDLLLGLHSLSLHLALQ